MLHDIGNGVYAYLLPNGSWGWSNAGLICDGEESLLVDTLFDEVLTADMLATMKAATDVAARIARRLGPAWAVGTAVTWGCMSTSFRWIGWGIRHTTETRRTHCEVSVPSVSLW